MCSLHLAEKACANVRVCVCVCVCATCVVVCVCVCVCRMSASLRVCMWSFVCNHLRTPCLELPKNEKKKTLIGVAPGIIVSMQTVLDFEIL